MIVTALPSRTGTPFVGGYSPAMAAKEALTRNLSAELAPHGIRVVRLRPHAMPETDSIQEVFNLKAATVMTWEQWQETLASRTHTRRLMTLAELATIISNKVTNWTLSDRYRAIEVSVTVARGAVPQHVIEILKRVAANQPGVIKEPVPQAYVVNFTLLR